MRRRPALEKGISARIIARLKKIPGCVIRKRHGTGMGVAGDPDIYGTIRGRHFEIEVKRPGDSSSQLTRLQAERLQEWSVAGAIVGVARSVGDALAIIGRAGIQNQPVWTCASCREFRLKGDLPPDRCPQCGEATFEAENAA